MQLQRHSNIALWLAASVDDLMEAEIISSETAMRSCIKADIIDPDCHRILSQLCPNVHMLFRFKALPRLNFLSRFFIIEWI